MALMALKEALGATEGIEQDFAVKEEPLAEIGGTVEERDTLLDALCSLRLSNT